MPNFCHFMLSKSKRVSNGLRSVDKEQVFFYPHLIAYFLYKQRKNFDLLVKTGAETPQKQENATL